MVRVPQTGRALVGVIDISSAQSILWTRHLRHFSPLHSDVFALLYECKARSFVKRIYIYIYYILCGYHCDKAVNKSDLAGRIALQFYQRFLVLQHVICNKQDSLARDMVLKTRE